MKTINVCSECQKRHENIPQGFKCNCGSTTFTPKEVPDDEQKEIQQEEKQEELDTMAQKNNKSLIHFKIEFDTDARNSKFSETITKILNKLLKTLLNLKVENTSKEEFEKQQEKKLINIKTEEENSLGLTDEERTNWK